MHARALAINARLFRSRAIGCAELHVAKVRRVTIITWTSENKVGAARKMPMFVRRAASKSGKYLNGPRRVKRNNCNAITIRSL